MIIFLYTLPKIQLFEYFFILLYKILNEEITLDKKSLLQKRKIKNATCSKFSKNFIHNKITKIHKGLVLLGLFDIFTVVTWHKILRKKMLFLIHALTVFRLKIEICLKIFYRWSNDSKRAWKRKEKEQNGKTRAV